MGNITHHIKWPFSSFKEYRHTVDALTNLENLTSLKNIEKRGEWHLDHMIPAKVGYDNRIAPQLIANISNLEMIPKYYNLNKSTFILKEHRLHITDIKHKNEKCNTFTKVGGFSNKQLKQLTVSGELAEIFRDICRVEAKKPQHVLEHLLSEYIKLKTPVETTGVKLKTNQD